MMDSISLWVKRQQDLLALELQEEESQLTDKIQSLSGKNCEAEGLSLLSLEVVESQSELFGRCSVILQKIGKHQLANGFRVGDEVLLYSPKLKSREGDEDANELPGIVKRVTQLTIQIVIEEYSNLLNEVPLRLDKTSSMKTHSKMIEVLKKLNDTLHPLPRLLFSDKNRNISDSMAFLRLGQSISWHSSTLNVSQKKAVQVALEAPRVAIIHGPPGTGKTSTLVELILQCLHLNLKVLVCAPSNIAVDTILLRLAQSWQHLKGAADSRARQRMVRLGHPARVTEAVLPYTLDHLISEDEGTEIVADVRKEIETLRTELKKNSRKSKEEEGPRTKREVKQELKSARKEVNRREREIVRRILTNSQIVLSTCVGAGSRLIQDMEFDVVVIDEAAQGLEAACWIPILLGKKVILAGDHCQLPPTIKSKEAVKELCVTLFERIITDNRFESVCTLLNVQYRMNDLISQWASHHMYHDEVVSDQTVANHSLSDMVPKNDDPVMLMVDTGGCFMYEDSVNDKSVSHCNVNEVQIVLLHVISLVRQGISAKHLGIITPYNGQIELLRSTFSTFMDNKHVHGMDLSEVEIKTIDGFQGGEKECIILSLVRSNERREVGFLGENRRINVAVTRAKRHLALICDTDTCSQDKFISTLISHIEEHGEVLGAEDFLAEHLEGMNYVPANIATNLAQKSSTAKSDVSKTKGKNSSNAKTNKIMTKPSKAMKNKETSANLGTKKDGLTNHSEKSVDFALEIEELLGQFKTKAMISNVRIKSAAYEIRYNELSNVAMLNFPNAMTSFERMVVHSCAEKVGLTHISKGEGNERYIEISKVLASHTEDPHALRPFESNNYSNKLENDRFDLIAKQTLMPEESEEEIEDAKDRTIVEGLLKPNADGLKERKNNKKKGKANGQAENNTKPNAFDKTDDEEEIFRLMDEENKKIFEAQKYRLKGIRPMPNYEKEHAKEKVKAKLAEAQASRLTKQAQELKKESTSSYSKTKTVKKPVPNFGGGKVGTK